MIESPNGAGSRVDWVKVVRQRGLNEVLSRGGVVPQEAGVGLDLELQVQPLPVRSGVPPGVRQDPVQGHDVAEGHLQGLILGQLFVSAPLGHHRAQPVEGRVQTLHPLPLPGVGGHPPPRGDFVFLRSLGVRLRELGSRVGAAVLAGLHGQAELSRQTSRSQSQMVPRCRGPGSDERLRRRA